MSSCRAVWIVLPGLLVISACNHPGDLADKIVDDAPPRVADDADEPPTFVPPEPTDYATLHNEHFGRGVTPDDNAVTYIVRALGPEAIPENQRAGVLRELGIGKLPEEGPYLVRHLPDDERDNDQRYEEDIAASSRPWQSDEFPWIIKWLETNKEPLRVIELASHCEHYYTPAVSRGVLSIDNMYIGTSNFSSAAYGLAWRAMLHAGEGRHDDAWAELMTIQRLASLLNQGSNMTDALMAIRFQMIAHRAQVGFFQDVPIPPTTAVAMRRDLDQFRKADLAEVYDYTERYSAMEWFDGFQHGELGQWEILLRGVDEELISRLAKGGHFDETVRRRVNHHIDEVVRAVRLPTMQQQRFAFEQIDKHYHQRVGSLFGASDVFQESLDEAEDDTERANLIADRMLELSSTAQSVYAQTQFTSEAMQRQLHIALALAAYHHDHDEYPNTLRDLTPKYLSEVPIDPCSFQPMRYKTQYGGYVLWSVGRNGIDDGGDDLYWDDLVVKDDRQYVARRREVIADWFDRGATFLVSGDESEDAALKNPEEIFSADFWNCEKFGDDDMEMIGTLANLMFLSMYEGDVTDAGVAHLRDLQHLRTVSLTGIGITDAGMEHLVGLKELREVSLRGTGVTDAGVTRLKTAIPGVEVRR